ncbi:hypothetical protein ACIP88_16970 [Streptomyces uncialis]
MPDDSRRPGRTGRGRTSGRPTRLELSGFTSTLDLTAARLGQRHVGATG